MCHITSQAYSLVNKLNIIYRILVLAKCDTIVEVREKKKKGEKTEI
jgi:hypothetical protein